MKHRFSISIFLAMLLAPRIASTAEDQWIHFVKDDRFDHYYNKTTMARTPNDIVGVWIKVVPRNKAVIDFLMDIRKKNGFLMDGFEDYQFSVTALEIDCRNGQSALIEQRDYGKGGKMLDKVRAVRRNWKDIPPNSYHDLYRKVLCKK